VSGSENLYQVEFYSHGNVRFPSFKHDNKSRRNDVWITFLNKFSKLETNKGMLHFQSHIPKNHITNLEIK